MSDSTSSIKPTLMERVKRRIIRSSLQPVAEKLLKFKTSWKILRQPELSEMFLEDQRADAIVQQFVKDDMNCIDIGCHLGKVTSQFLRLAPNGTHFAFEPTPHKFEWLKKTYPEVNVKQLAVGEEPGELDFYFYPKDSGYSGLKPQLNGKQEATVVTVEVDRLDNALPADLPIGFIKLDVEGAELQVLRGAEQTLTKYRPPVLFECTLTGLKAFEYEAKDIFDTFASYDYRIYLFKSWLHRGMPLSADAFDSAMRYPFSALNFLAVHKDCQPPTS